MASVIKAGNATDGVQVTSDNTGILELKTGTGSGTTAVTIGTDQAVTFAQAANLPNTFGFKNRIINGDMRIDQRNAGASVSISGTPIYLTDRFIVRAGTGSGHTAARSTDAPTGFKNSLAITIGTGGTPASGDGVNYLVQYIEGFNAADLGFGAAGASTVTISFWVKSSLTGQFGASLVNYALSRSYPFTFTINAANTWEQKSVTIAGDTTGTWSTDNSGWGGILFDLGNGATYLGTAGAWAGADYRGATGDVKLVSTSGATFRITGVQLEKGSTATSFDYRPYGTELQLCQRYYYRITSSGDNIFGVGYNISTTQNRVVIPFFVPMRIAPTALEQTGTASNYRILYASTADACSSVPTFNAITSNINAAVLFTVASGLTTGHGSGAQVAPSTTAYLGWSAEL